MFFSPTSSSSRPIANISCDAISRFRIAPDLVVEVLSSGTARNDRGRKMQTFARFGVAEYWMADPAKNRLDVWRLARGKFELHAHVGPGDRVQSIVLPQLTFEVDPIFAD